MAVNLCWDSYISFLLLLQQIITNFGSLKNTDLSSSSAVQKLDVILSMLADLR